MKVLVTGAAGRVGANVVRRLVDSGAEVKALVMPGDPLAAKLDGFSGVEIVEGDLGDYRALREACRGVSHIAHLAAQMIRGDTEVGRYYEINALSTLRLLEAVQDTGAELERFLLASTDSTFRPGDSPPVPLTEQSPQAPVNHYGMSKLLGEVILRNRAAETGIPYAIVRFTTVLSPDEADGLFRFGFLRGWMETQRELGKESGVWPLLHKEADLLAQVDRAADGAAAEAAASLVGPDGPWIVSMVDVRDAAQGVVKALTAPGAVGGSFNLAGPRDIDFSDAADLIAERFGVAKVTIPMPTTWRLQVSTDAARRDLGFEPEYDLAATLSAAGREEDFVPANEGPEGVYAQMSGRRSET
jgi:nucleoside-diphosphate-sugar epimerase